MRYEYHINLDERGDFYADVRDESENTVLEVRGFGVFEDGYMRRKNDISGLNSYLLDLGIIKDGDTLDIA